MKLILVLAIAVLCGAAHAQSVDRSVFGVELGKPLNVPECAKRKSAGGTMEFYLSSIEITANCFHIERGNDRFLDIPMKQQPMILNAGSSPRLIIIDGNVEAVHFTTYGMREEQQTFDALVAKYGAPTRVEPGATQTLNGAQFTTRDAYWQLPDLHVSYWSVTDRVTSGRVIVETDRGRAAAAQELKRRGDERQKL
jgi:hypothetical protein